MKPIIVVAGPTATGKTRLAVQLGLLLNRRSVKFKIINFDTLCFYRELNIGTAKPTAQERRGLPHELLGHRSIADPLNAFQFRTQALAIVDRLHEQRAVPVFVGGGGFYIRAFVKGLYQSPPAPPELRREILSLYQTRGIEPFRRYLEIHDKNSHDRLHPNDHYRNMRAVEYHRLTKQPLSRKKEQFDKGAYDFSKPQNPSWSVHTLYLDTPRPQHWAVIQKRTRQMLERGLVGEVRDLLDRGFTGLEKPLAAIGYKEAQAYLKGGLAKRELQEKIDVSTRQLAKAQRTFFKKIFPKTVLPPPLQDAALPRMAEAMKNWEW